jgi:long-chain acyl-CoA synthetase
MQWLAHYDQGVPATLGPYPERTLLDDLAEAVAQRPEAPALLFKGRTTSHGELDRRSDAFAAALAGLGWPRATGWPCCCPTAPSS